MNYGLNRKHRVILHRYLFAVTLLILFGVFTRLNPPQLTLASQGYGTATGLTAAISRTSPFPQTLWMALQRSPPPKSLIHHSDRGSQYSSRLSAPVKELGYPHQYEQYRQLLRQCTGGKLLGHLKERMGTSSTL